jgi:hypothetical protein
VSSTGSSLPPPPSHHAIHPPDCSAHIPGLFLLPVLGGQPDVNILWVVSVVRLAAGAGVATRVFGASQLSICALHVLANVHCTCWHWLASGCQDGRPQLWCGHSCLPMLGVVLARLPAIGSRERCMLGVLLWFGVRGQHCIAQAGLRLRWKACQVRDYLAGGLVPDLLQLGTWRISDRTSMRLVYRMMSCYGCPVTLLYCGCLVLVHVPLLPSVGWCGCHWCRQSPARAGCT